MDIDWNALDESKAAFDKICESMSCWWCQKPLGKAPPLYLDGAWACHPVCAKPASELSGRPITM